MINRFDQFTPLTFNLPETPLEPLTGALQAKQQMYDTSQNLADDLSNQYIDALQQDQARANALTSGWQESIDAMVDNYNGDYSQMYGELRGLKRDITKAFSPQGEAGAIEANKKAYVTALENERKRLEKGEITQSQLQAWGNYTLGNYEGIGEQDPMTKSWNQLNPESIAKFVNGEELARNAAKEIVAQEGGTEMVYSNGRYIMKKGDKWEVVQPGLIQSVVERSLSNNPEYRNYLSQQSKFTGTDFEANWASSIGNYANQMAKTYAKNNIWHTEDMKVDQWGIFRAKQAMIEGMMAPRGATRAGLTQSRDISKFKLPVPGSNNTDMSNAMSTQAQLQSSPWEALFGGEVDTDVHGPSTQTNANFAQYHEKVLDSDMFENKPILKKVWLKTYADVTQQEGFEDMSEQQKMVKAAELYNQKIERMPLNYETTMATFMPSAAKEMTSIVRSRGASDAVSWFKVTDGGLGVRAKQNPVKEAMDSSNDSEQFIAATDVATIDGTTGVVTVVNGETWLGVGIMDDKQSAAITPAAQMDDLYRTGATQVEFLMPAFDQTTGAYKGVTPNRMRFDGTIDGDGNMSGNLVQIDSRGNVINTIAEGMGEMGINKLRGMLVESASAELNSNLDVSSQQIQYGDPKGRFDQTPIINMLLD